MNCSFCGHVFDEAATRHQCQGCALAEGCRRIRCPRCGYEMPEEIRTPEWLKSWKGKLIKMFSSKSVNPHNDSERSECRLAEMYPGQTGTVTQILSGNGNELQKLLALGVLPGLSLRLKRRSPSFVFEAGYSEFAIDNRIAEIVLVSV